ncbi:MAG: DUF2341 domain-containing protein [Endomicrobia bacterium]|nr:DUF2341 domain-containing protein [Endomicrobiia bacterium]
MQLKYRPMLLIAIYYFTVSFVSAANWTENNRQDLIDGFFYRSTVTIDGRLRVKQWDDWWNTGWPQRIPIEINNVGNPSQLNDYQLWFVINSSALVSAGKLDYNGTSIRIADSDGKTLLPFWLENWNVVSSTGSKIWVKVPQIPSDSKSYIYVYIRNISTNSVSNRDAVFDLYEDWETGRIRTQTPWSDTGWVYGGSSVFEIHTSTDLIYNYTTQSNEVFNVFSGNYAVRSGNISHSQNLYLQTTLNLNSPARIEFYWACFSEGGNYDYLSFYLGAAEQGRIQGNANWTFVAFNLSEGPNILKWEYRKDNSGTSFFDRGFIDKIVVRKYNWLFDSQIQQRVSLQNIEEYSLYYRYAEYYSNVFDTQGENSSVIYTSWTEVLNGQTAEIYFRSSDDYFTFLSTWPQFTTVKLTNNSNPIGIISPGRYFQYKVRLYSDGLNTPELRNINFTYLPYPLRAYDFKGVAISSTSILWSWTNRATYYIDGYIIYSSTRQYNKDGKYLVVTSSSDGILAYLSASTTYWIEENLTPNTQYGRYVVAYTTTIVSFGGNASKNIAGKDEPSFVYTLALPPLCKPEKYETTQSPPYYRFVEISTEVWYNTKEFSFTSAYSTGPGKVAYYRYIFTTTSTWSDSSAYVWYPNSSTYVTGGGEEIVERPILNLIATQNSNNWFFQVKSYNGDNIESGYQIFGPFWFNGCPSQITDLVVTVGKGEEGKVFLSWSAPTDDAETGNLINAKYVIKYRLAGIIDTDEKFDAITQIISSTGIVQGVVVVSTNAQAGQIQSYVLSGLVPGLTYWFTIRVVDSNDNKSLVATNVNSIYYLRCRSSKVSKIEFITPSYTFYAGDVSPKIEVRLVDDDGDEIKSRFGAECDLLTTSSKGSFSLDGTNFGIGKLNILAGTSRSIFYYMDENSGLPEISVSEISALNLWNGPQRWKSTIQTHEILPGKAISFRIVPQDGNYNCQILVDKPVYIEAVDKLGNRAIDFEGVAIVTTSFSGMFIEPSYLTFGLSDQGRISGVLRNYYYAGPSSMTIYEIVSQDYKKIIFNDYYNGYLVGNKGILKATSESGGKWFTKIYRNDTTKGLNSVAIFENLGILCGKNGLVLISTNSFVSYVEKNIYSNNLNDVVFIDSKTVLICGDNGVIFKSTNVGLSFNTINSGISDNLNSIVFVSSNVGFICGNNGKLLRTIDGANNFSEINTNVNSNLYGMKFLDEQLGFICGANSLLLKTEDGADNFNNIYVSTINYTLYGVDFITPQIGVVCGSGGKVFITTSSAASFYDISPYGVSTEIFYSIKMLDLNKIIIVGSNGSIYLTTDRGVNWQKIEMYGKSPQNYLWNATIISSFNTLATKVVQGRSNQTITRLAVRYAYPSVATTKINKLTVKKLGTLPDEYITAVKVAGLGQGSFINGIAEILLPSQPTIKYTTSYFDVQVDLSPDAPLDTTFALQFDFGCINVSQGVQFGRNNLPYITYKDTTTLEYLLVVPPVVNVFIVDIDTSAYLRTYTGFDKTKILEQGDNGILLKIGLMTDRSVSPFRKLRINISGNNFRDEDIKLVKMYVDYPFIEENIVSSATFQGGIAFLDFAKPQTVSDKTTSYFYITAEISPEASYSRDITEVNFIFKIDISTQYFILDAEGVNTISSKLVSLNNEIISEKIRLEISKDIVYVRTLSELVSRIPEKVYQSERMVLLPLGVSVGKRGLGSAQADWSRLRVDKSTMAADSYNRFERSSWTLVEVWKDINGNGLLDTTDIKLGESKFENNIALIIFNQPEKIDKQEYLKEYTTYFVVSYIPKNAMPDEKLHLYLSTGTYFTLGGVDIVESGNFPLISPTITIADWPDEVSFEPTSLAPVEAALYETDVLLARFDLLAFCDATLEEMLITHEGTSEPDTSVKLIKVYLDDGDLRFDKDKDVVVSTGTFDGTGKCKLKMFNPANSLKYDPVLVLDEKVRIFVTFDFNENAIPDKTIGFGLDPTGLNYNLPNRQKQFGYFSTSKIILLDKRTPTKPKIKPYVPLNYGIDTGKEIENLVYYIPDSNKVKFNWFSEAPHGGGIKSGFAGISLRKPLNSLDTPDIVSFISIGDVGDFTLTGLNLEHNKVYYLWIKSESNAGFVRLNYVPLFIDNTSSLRPHTPTSTIPSNNIFWLNTNVVDDEESFIIELEISERVHQEYVWSDIRRIEFPLQNLIRDIYALKLQKKLEDKNIIFSTRSVLSEEVIVEYNFIVTTHSPTNLEVVNFKTLFSNIGYKLHNYNIKIENRFSDKLNSRIYYYRTRTKNVVGLYSDYSDISKAVYLSLPNKTILELTTFPNPCDVRKKSLNLSYILTEEAETHIRIFDILGNLVYEKSFNFDSVYSKQGTHFIEIPESKNFSAGMYIVNLETKNKNGTVDSKKWKIGIIR